MATPMTNPVHNFSFVAIRRNHGRLPFTLIVHKEHDPTLPTDFEVLEESFKDEKNMWMNPLGCEAV
jgi:hypothetical protein